MKKFLKVFSSLCLVVIVACAVLLSGCAKKFNVNVSATVGGAVYKIGSEAVSLKGDNEVEQGKNFRCSIIAEPGYYIAKVTVNNKEVDISNWKKEDDGYVSTHKLEVENIQKDTSVVVTFDKKIKKLTINFVDSNSLNTTIQSVAYNIPCLTEFALFNKDGGVTGEADLFYALNGEGLLSIQIQADFTIRAYESDSTKISEIIAALDANVFTAEKGCTKVA